MDHIRIRAHARTPQEPERRSAEKTGLIVITGLSGSGKSSLAFDTPTRRAAAATSSRSRLRAPVPAADGKARRRSDRGLSPAISIEQKGGRATTALDRGTITEIHDYLRLCMRASDALLPGAQTAPAGAVGVADGRHALALHQDTKLMILAPIVASARRAARAGRGAAAQGFARFASTQGS